MNNFLDVLGSVHSSAKALSSPKPTAMANKEIELLNEALRWLEPDEENELLKAIARDYARRDPQHFESMLRSSFATVTDGEAIEEQ
jgi:hypothetical protein